MTVLSIKIRGETTPTFISIITTNISFNEEEIMLQDTTKQFAYAAGNARKSAKCIGGEHPIP